MAGKSLRPLIKRLQTAIALQQGRRISISTFQTYSPTARRTATKYVVSELDPARGRYVTIVSTWALPDVVKALAGILQGAGDSAAGKTAGDNAPDHRGVDDED